MLIVWISCLVTLARKVVRDHARVRALLWDVKRSVHIVPGEDKVAELMMVNLNVSGQPIFRATGAVDRGQLKSKGNGKLSIRFCADEATIEEVLRTIISVIQLRIYGAVADLYVKHWLIQRKPHAVMESSESMVAPTDVLDIQRQLPTGVQAQYELLFNHEDRVQNLSDEQQLIKMCTDAGFVKTCVPGQYFMTKDAE